MSAVRDPFRVLSLAYDASAEDVRSAFRRLARETHPDRGGSATAFHEVRLAYGALSANLDAERTRWRPAPEPTRASRYAAGLDPRIYPTCTVRVGPAREGGRALTYEMDSRPSAWRPGAVPPPGGECVSQVEATESMPAFGVWMVRLDADRVRIVFGPSRSL
ncbi:MAG: DnaJ domain-containing protein [Bacteroidota bacterium]